MILNLIQRSCSEMTCNFLSQRTRNLMSYHVKTKVMFLQRLEHLSCNSCILRVKLSSISSQTATIVSMDDPSLKKYLLNILDGNTKNKNWRRPNYWSTLNELVTQRETLVSNITSLNELQQGEDNDKELKALAEEELSTYKTELHALDNNILRIIMPRNKHEAYSDILVEISSGAGGQEAMIFAYELLQMYENYAFLRGWTFFIESIDKTDLGGIRSVSIFIHGDGAYYYMQNEIGVHRVQRVPVTSTSGMIHTSTAAVIIMPQPTEVDIKIEEKDLVFETMRASGPGGQNVNKTESAVRLRHLPSGLVVESQEKKSQIQNREVALRKLRTKLFDIETQKQNMKITTTRVSQLQNRERSAKIRTYNFPQNRVTDHRGHVTTHNIKEFMEGRNTFHNFLEKLNEEHEKQLFLQFIDDIRSNC